MSRESLRENVNHVMEYLPHAVAFYREDDTEALVLTRDNTIIAVFHEGDTAETKVSWSTGFEV